MATATPVMRPPAAPRILPSNYGWRLFFLNASGIVALVFGILGSVFTLVGFILTVAIVTAFVGVPFMFLGLIALAVAWVTFRHQQAKVQATLAVLRDGQAVLGQLTQIEQDYALQINGRHPWVMSYQFSVAGRQYQGETRALRRPTHRADDAAYVLYAAADPTISALYLPEALQR
jgi:hypothetical protein